MKRQMDDQKNIRIAYIDATKGLGIFITMVVHSCGFPIMGKYFQGFFLPVFWVIMGYFTPEITRNDLPKMIKKSFRNLIFPYVVCNLFLVPMGWAKTALGGGTISIGYIMRTIGGVFYGRYMIGTSLDEPIIIFEELNHPLWFLPASYFSVWIFYIVKVKIKYWKVKSVAVCCMICIIIAKLLSYLPILLPWSMDTAGCIIIFLIVGDIVKQQGGFDRNVVPGITYIVVGVGYLTMCKMDTVANIAIRMYGKSIALYIVKGIVGSLLCIMFFRFVRQWRIVTLLSALGRVSLSILCWHVCVFNVIDGITFSVCHYTLEKLRSNMPVANYFYCVGEIILTVIIICLGRMGLRKFKSEVFCLEPRRRA